MSLPAGTRLGPYEVVALLGRGGMGDDGRFIVTRREAGTPGMQIVSKWSAEMTRLLAAGGVK